MPFRQATYCLPSRDKSSQKSAETTAPKQHSVLSPEKKGGQCVQGAPSQSHGGLWPSPRLIRTLSAVGDGLSLRPCKFQRQSSLLKICLDFSSSVRAESCPWFCSRLPKGLPPTLSLLLSRTCEVPACLTTPNSARTACRQ